MIMYGHSGWIQPISCTDAFGLPMDGAALFVARPATAAPKLRLREAWGGKRKTTHTYHVRISYCLTRLHTYNGLPSHSPNQLTYAWPTSRRSCRKWGSWSLCEFAALQNLCIYICVYVCLYLCMYVCMYVRVCVYVYVCMHACTHACMYACMYVCIYVCVYVYVCICMYMLVYV